MTESTNVLNIELLPTTLFKRFVIDCGLMLAVTIDNIFSPLALKVRSLAAALKDAKTAISIGSFDGPHIGHKALFAKTAEEAEKRGLLPGAVTFKTPLGGTPISTLEERLKCFETYGMKFALVVDFSLDFAKIEGSVFFDLLRENLHCKFIAEGEDFHCGRGGLFGKKEIAAYCAAHNMECCFLPSVMCGGVRVSSSAIRAAIAAGDAKTAKMMLGN